MSVCWGSGWFLKDFLTGLAHIMPRTEYCFWKTALESEKKCLLHCMCINSSTASLCQAQCWSQAHAVAPGQQSCAAHGQKDALLSCCLHSPHRMALLCSHWPCGHWGGHWSKTSVAAPQNCSAAVSLHLEMLLQSCSCHLGPELNQAVIRAVSTADFSGQVT